MHGETGPVTLKPVQSTAPVGFYLHLRLLSTALQPQEMFGKTTEPQMPFLSFSPNLLTGQICSQFKKTKSAVL